MKASDEPMNAADADVQHGGAHKIVSVEITKGPGPLPHGVFEQAPRVIALSQA